MTGGKIVVLGVGNILLSDEGAGVHAAQRMIARYTFAKNVRVLDGGVTGMVGLLPIIEETDHLILLDAVLDPGPPGTVRRYSLSDFKREVPKKLSSHDIGFLDCLAIAEATGRAPKSVVVIGVKPYDMATLSMNLSDTVAGRIDDMIQLALTELGRFGVIPEPVGKKISEASAPVVGETGAGC